MLSPLSGNRVAAKIGKTAFLELAISTLPDNLRPPVITNLSTLAYLAFVTAPI